MASNRLEDSNDMLFNELSRLDEDDITPDKLTKEIARAKAMSAVGSTIIENANTVLKAAEIYDKRESEDMKLPHMIGLDKHDEQKKI